MPQVSPALTVTVDPGEEMHMLKNQSLGSVQACTFGVMSLDTKHKPSNTQKKYQESVGNVVGKYMDITTKAPDNKEKLLANTDQVF